MSKTIAAVLFTLTATGYADPLPAPSTYTPTEPSEAEPAPLVQPAAPQAAPVNVDDGTEGAAFSGKRLAAEIGGGELVSLLVSFATYNGLCNGHDCMGSALAAYGVDFAVTPLAIWAGGRALGGHGSLGWTYLGASTSLAAFSATGQPDETPADTMSRINVEMAISALLMPVTSALLFEVSSQVWFKSHHVTLAVNPTLDRGHTTGATGGITVGF
jgi:hypothetical protein